MIDIDPDRCSFPGCPHPERAKGLCTGHYRQQLRGRPLTPLIRQGPALAMVGLRVDAATRAVVLADPDGARAALTRWARRRTRR